MLKLKASKNNVESLLFDHNSSLTYFKLYLGRKKMEQSSVFLNLEIAWQRLKKISLSSLGFSYEYDYCNIKSY